VAHRILAEAKAVASQKPKAEGPDPRQAPHSIFLAVYIRTVCVGTMSTPRVGGLRPGKHHIHVSLAVYIRIMSVGIVSKSRVGA